MNAMSTFTPDPATSNALREVFRRADKAQRQQLVPILPPEVIEFAGVKMYVDPRDNFTDRMIWRDGHPPEIQSLMALTQLVEGRNALVLDIGANSGAFAIPLAVAAGKGSRVIAFEPSPVMIGRLGYNVQLNDLGHLVRIEGCALGAAAGEAMLNFRERNFGQASLLPVKEHVRTGGALVPVRPLLDFVGEASGHDICVLKIDVEGAEVDVLAPLLDAGGWMPDALLVETDHADAWDVDLVGRIIDMGFEITLEAEQNTLFVRKGAA
ncbi:Methyltransferase, FkbM family [Sulfitobacter noctilucicola]|uniref:FkbM family methyltransferase n=1 Tax=Sulfitobacter noctilucicola TaxID=1342301 RepID=A0A7W6Q4M0_9RHOB|nr:FkbM family methyltransferase [Sulfitobacter noctilucicola]KIN63688.1 Methyltransferase, FkbM family [Sulfitobacter noctilucicola]MBB4174803.1 FkbM family methyltransferase [Sulfitobacter noctilucicola]